MNKGIANELVKKERMKFRLGKKGVDNVYLGFCKTGLHINTVHGGDKISRGEGISINTSWKIPYMYIWVVS